MDIRALLVFQKLKKKHKKQMYRNLQIFWGHLTTSEGCSRWYDQDGYFTVKSKNSILCNKLVLSAQKKSCYQPTNNLKIIEILFTEQSDY